MQTRYHHRHALRLDGTAPAQLGPNGDLTEPLGVAGEEPGVASGFQGFWTQVLIGVVFLLSVTLNMILEDSNRVPLLRRLRGGR